MKKIGMIGAAVLLAAAVAGAAAASDDTLFLRSAMKDRVNPAIFGIWDITNNAMDDNGGIDAKLMNADKWAIVEARARDLAQASRALASATTIRANAPGDEKVDAGAVPMSAIQGYLDANPAAFRALATTQAEHAEKLAAAAKAHDAAAAGELVAGLDGVCESCHSRFWYPDQ
ncbi:MAG: hypothetical protein RLZZ08_413 [Pseudomonadota bacterium]|jgi:cytochrome c556